MKKEWKKPFVRVIVLDGEDIIATSNEQGAGLQGFNRGANYQDKFTEEE